MKIALILAAVVAVSMGHMVNCPSSSFLKSSTTPTSVHKLRPGDIKVIAALGDSLTAGFETGALTPLGLLTEGRGRSWSIGGAESLDSVVTLPDPFGTYNPSAENLLAQAEALVDHMKNNKAVDFDKDWKVITMSVGANAAFEYFDLKKKQKSPTQFILGIREALDYLSSNVPKVFVNLIEVPDVSTLSDISKGKRCPSCSRRTWKNIASGGYKNIKTAINAYNKEITALVKSGRYDSRDDFTVVVQTCFRDITLQKQQNGDPDLSYFSPDCYHLSKAQAAAAKALWNNMLEPVGGKQVSQHPELGPISCMAGERPFLATYKNSYGGSNTALTNKKKDPNRSYNTHGDKKRDLNRG